MPEGGTYGATRARVEAYFGRTATRTWEALTSDAPVSRIRQTVREGRDAMRGLMLSRLPEDLSGTRVLDAGCGAGQMSAELARRGADVVGVDLAPELLDIARRRLPAGLPGRVEFRAGDMLDPALGLFDHVVAMDSLIYYDGADLAAALKALSARVSGRIVFTVAPRTPLLMAMWGAGRLFPRSDRSPTMVPHSPGELSRRLAAANMRRPIAEAGRVARGFYISTCLELRP